MSFVQLTFMILLVWAVVPYPDIQSNSNNILSILAEAAVQAKWLRYWLVVDAVLVLCASIPSYIKTLSDFRYSYRDNISMRVYGTISLGSNFAASLPPSSETQQSTLCLHYYLCHPQSRNVWCGWRKLDYHLWSVHPHVPLRHGPLRCVKSSLEVQPRSVGKRTSREHRSCTFSIGYCCGGHRREYCPVSYHRRLLYDIFCHHFDYDELHEPPGKISDDAVLAIQSK